MDRTSEIEVLEGALSFAEGAERVEILNRLARRYLDSSPPKTIEYALRALEEARALEDVDGQLDALKLLGNAYFIANSFERARDIYAEALDLAQRKGNAQKEADLLNNMGLVYWKLCRYDDAIDYLTRALRAYESLGDAGGVARAHENIGIVHFSLNDFEGALRYFEKALEVWEKLGDGERIAATLNNVGTLYREKGELSKALEFLLRALELKRSQSSIPAAANSVANVGALYAEMGETEKALEFFDEAEKLYAQVGDAGGLAQVASKKAKMLLACGDAEGAAKLLQNALEHAKRSGSKDITLELLEDLAEAYAKLRRYKKAYEVAKEATELRKEIFSDRLQRAVAEAEIKYETERKEREAELYRLKYVELREANERLREAQKRLETYQNELERLVEQRTAELVEAHKALQESYAKLKETFDGIVQTMTKLVEFRDPYTAGHQERVAKLAVAIARRMGLDEDTVEAVRPAAVVHDIGKIYVPAEILTKPGRLSEIEFMLIKNHSAAGYEILRSINFPWDIATIVRQHHERLDGSGYPDGISGDDIRIEARIIAVADVVEAISSHRPYRPALGLDVAIDEIQKGAGRLYDPAVVKACVEVLRSGKFEW